jgi:hypothetical protein
MNRDKQIWDNWWLWDFIDSIEPTFNNNTNNKPGL